MKSRRNEFGDFQTPMELASLACEIAAIQEVSPRSIVEPTCGVGNFLMAALKRFPNPSTVLALELNPDYFSEVSERASALKCRSTIDLRCDNFFTFDWPRVLSSLPEPIIVVGNPPWVTSSQLGSLGSANLPDKSNFQKRRGLDAITGKGNFDIAEWMLIRLIECLAGRRATIAVLLKTSVARKVLIHAWHRSLPVAHAAMHVFNAAKYFGVAVDACLLVCKLLPGTSSDSCTVRELLAPSKSRCTIGYHKGLVLADKATYERLRHLERRTAAEPRLRWRSGIKHDCAKVMELHQRNGTLVNGFSEPVDVEPDFLYPMLKGSQVARRPLPDPSRFMIVTQQKTGQDTQPISHLAPRTWRYLCEHGDLLDGRRSSIYRNRPRFSIFGVGPYTFAPWKIAICGLYKKLDFAVIGPHEQKPIVLDDTCYHLSFRKENVASLVASLLNSSVAKEFYESFIFWDTKRPITAELLHRLDLVGLAEELGMKGHLEALDPRLAATASLLG